MKKTLLMCGLIATTLAACGGGGTTRTPPTVQTPNTFDVRLPAGSSGTQHIPVLAQPTVVQTAPVVQQTPYVQPQSAPAPYTPSQYNHASVANAGTTAVSDDYVRASTEVFSCNNGSTVTIKHLEADTITIALNNTTGNSILKLVASNNGIEVYRGSAGLFGKPTEWQQKSAQANLRFMNASNQISETACTLQR